MQKSYGRLEQNKNKEIVTKNDRPASGAGFERAVLVAVIRDQQDPRQAEEYLAELEFLAETAGIVGVRRFTQRLPQPSARIYVGPGKLEEIAAYCKEEEIDVAIFDDELSPSQTRNIEAAMPCRILDRTRLILDIFMSRAQTAYAKTQVQLANYQYMLPRLSGMWTHLERQRGGTGTRGGAGEREIETDRRIIRNRISKLKEDLQKIDRQMAVQRSNRGSMVRVALVGYTNVGKSTFINSFAGKACAKTGNKPGVTKGNQWIRLNKSLELLDTPGILWPKFEDQTVGIRLALIGSINDEILNKDELALELIRFLQKQYPNVLEDKYQADASDAVELLNQIAKARACLSKGGELDLAKASRLLIDDFRNGKLGKITLELPPECPSGNTNVEQTCDEKVK